MLVSILGTGDSILKKDLEKFLPSWSLMEHMIIYELENAMQMLICRPLAIPVWSWHDPPLGAVLSGLLGESRAVLSAYTQMPLLHTEGHISMWSL